MGNGGWRNDDFEDGGGKVIFRGATCTTNVVTFQLRDER